MDDARRECLVTYGTMYGMVKTTLYLPEELKHALERLAAEERISEAEIVRRALRREVGDLSPPEPRVPLVARELGDPTLAERVDQLLEGFGEP